VIEGEDGLYLKQYSDEKYEEDIKRINHITLQNGVISIGIALFIGGSGLLMWKMVNRFWYLSESSNWFRVKSKRKRKDLTKNQKKVIASMTTVVILLGLSIAILFFGPCVMWLTIAVSCIIVGIIIYLFKEEGKYYWFLLLWLIYTIFVWGLTLLCMKS